MSQGELADACGVTQGTISKLEADDIAVSDEMLNAIAKTLPWNLSPAQWALARALSKPVAIELRGLAAVELNFVAKLALKTIPERASWDEIEELFSFTMDAHHSARNTQADAEID